jgi:solute carrier family 25 (mitochondrial adenine nucleotide translocator), member 4/5/6/31
MSTQPNLILDFFAGGMSGVISKTVCAPIERVKLLMQTSSSNQRITKPYTSVSIYIILFLSFGIMDYIFKVLDCFNRCIREEGFLSLWRGNWANVVRYFPT